MSHLPIQRVRRKPLEAVALSLGAVEKLDELDFSGFPIPITKLTPTGDFVTDGVYGPLPTYDIEWTDMGGISCKGHVNRLTVLVARKCCNSDSLWLDFVSPLTFRNEYEPIPK